LSKADPTVKRTAAATRGYALAVIRTGMSWDAIGERSLDGGSIDRAL